MRKSNTDIRLAMMKKGVNQTEVANKLGVNRATFCTWLRCELPKERKTEILEAIKEM